MKLSIQTDFVCSETIYQTHHNAVSRPLIVVESTQVEILGESRDDDNHGFYDPKKTIVVQGHPEFNKAIMESFIYIGRGI
jgi:GMP synthase-like glutamine amidotransferase